MATQDFEKMVDQPKDEGLNYDDLKLLKEIELLVPASVKAELKKPKVDFNAVYKAAKANQATELSEIAMRSAIYLLRAAELLSVEHPNGQKFRDMYGSSFSGVKSLARELEKNVEKYQSYKLMENAVAELSSVVRPDGKLDKEPLYK
jgi:hypothetical protein